MALTPGRAFASAAETRIVELARMGRSRRQFLFAGAGLAAIAGGGITATELIDTHPTDRPPPSGWLEHNGTLRSRYMHEPVGWTVVRPQRLAPRNRLLPSWL